MTDPICGNSRCIDCCPPAPQEREWYMDADKLSAALAACVLGDAKPAWVRVHPYVDMLPDLVHVIEYSAYEQMYRAKEDLASKSKLLRAERDLAQTASAENAAKTILAFTERDAYAKSLDTVSGELLDTIKERDELRKSLEWYVNGEKKMQNECERKALAYREQRDHLKAALEEIERVVFVSGQDVHDIVSHALENK